MTRWIAFLSSLAMIASCSETPTLIPTKNLDHPADMAFLCLGVTETGGPPMLSGQPMSACHPETAPDPAIFTTTGQRTLGTFGFILDFGRGEIAVADMDKGRLIDLGPAAAGYGLLPVAGKPVFLAASDKSCWVAVGTQSSCTLGIVDPARILSDAFSDATRAVQPASGEGPVLQSLPIVTAKGRPLGASVGEMAFLPSPEGTACASDPNARIVATFPGCDLVALLELSPQDGNAKIVDSVYLRPELAEGVVPAGTEPLCPQECSRRADAGDAVSSADGGVGDGGAALANASRVQPLVLLPTGDRVYVGSLRDPSIFAFTLRQDRLEASGRLTLAEGAAGIQRLRLAVDPFQRSQGLTPQGEPRTFQGRFLDGRGRFIYAFAQDSSVRVIDIDAWIECDVNVEPGEDRARACFPIGSAPRKPLADGPGIRIPVFSNPLDAPPMPRDITFVDLQPPDATNPHSLRGQYGFLLASNNKVYILNLAPADEPETRTHSFREYRALGATAKSPLELGFNPQRSGSPTDMSYAVVRTFSSLEGPQIATFSGGDTPYLQFPDHDSIVSQAWELTWEGVLPRGRRISGIVSQPESAALAGHIFDRGGDFCAIGVQPLDLVLFPGCDRDAQCQPDDVFYCERSISGGRGMCLKRTSKSDEGLRRACNRYMNSRRRYEIVSVEANRLDLALKLDEVPKSTLNPCSVVTEGDPNANAKIAECQPNQDHGPFPGITVGTEPDKGFECLEIQPNTPRCVKRCGIRNAEGWVPNDQACRLGTVCEFVPGMNVELGPLCVEGPPIDPMCWPLPVSSYQIQAGKSFLVTASELPTPRNFTASDAGLCQSRADRANTFTNRIPLNTPECPDGFLDQAESQGVALQMLPPWEGANPCLFREPEDQAMCPQDASVPGDAPPYCTPPFRAYFQNPQVRFVLKNLDDYIADSFAIYYEVSDGFFPLTVQIPSYEIIVTTGIRILTGPMKTPESPVLQNPATGTSYYPYLYVIDQGRTALTSGSRGQVLRINPRKDSASDNATFDLAVSGSRPFQLQ